MLVISFPADSPLLPICGLVDLGIAFPVRNGICADWTLGPTLIAFFVALLTTMRRWPTLVVLAAGVAASEFALFGVDRLVQVITSTVPHDPWLVFLNLLYFPVACAASVAGFICAKLWMHLRKRRPPTADVPALGSAPLWRDHAARTLLVAMILLAPLAILGAMTSWTLAAIPALVLGVALTSRL